MRRKQIKVENARAGYEIATNLWISENEMLWSKFNALLVANSIVLTSIVLSMTARKPLVTLSILMSIAGIILCGLWFLVMKRSSDYHKLWVYSAREIEEQSLSNSVKTLSRGYTFHNKEKVEFIIGGEKKPLQMSRLGRFIPVRMTFYMVIVLFFLLYAVLLIINIHGLTKNVNHSSEWLTIQGDIMSQYETFSLCLNVLTLVFLAIYVAKTWSIAKSSKDAAEQTKHLIEETRLSRDEETAPRIIVFLDLHEHVAELVVRNIGKSVANNVKISIEPDISNLLDKSSAEYYATLFAQGIKMLVPDQEIRAFLNTTPEMFEKPEARMTYNIQVSYEGGLLGKQRVNKSSINLGLFANRTFISKPGMKHIVKELENIREAIVALGSK
jgi:hypothetical protein